MTRKTARLLALVLAGAILAGRLVTTQPAANFEVRTEVFRVASFKPGTVIPRRHAR